GSVDCAKFPAKNSQIPRDLPAPQMTVAMVASCFLACAMLVERWMRENAKQEHCLIVWEDNEHTRKFVKAVQNYHQDRRVLEEAQREFASDDVTKYFPLSRIAEDPLFQPKKQSNPLELADFCAYVGKRLVMDFEHPIYRPIFEKMRKSFVRF